MKLLQLCFLLPLHAGSPMMPAAHLVVAMEPVTLPQSARAVAARTEAPAPVDLVSAARVRTSIDGSGINHEDACPCVLILPFIRSR